MCCTDPVERGNRHYSQAEKMIPKSNMSIPSVVVARVTERKTLFRRTGSLLNKIKLETVNMTI